MSSQFGRCAELTAREFNLRVGRSELFSGGGSVAAPGGRHACALALLVGRLSARRRVNADAQATIVATLASIEALTEWFYGAADQDLIVLDELLAAQRALKQGGARADFTAALLRAARSPLELAERCAQLVAHVNSLTPSASRFTVSDLGAAAALAAGACRAALLTVDVNIALLRDERCVDQSVVEPLAARADDTFASVAKLDFAVPVRGDRRDRSNSSRMSAELLDGRPVARVLRERARAELNRYRNTYGRTPGLAVVLIGDDLSASAYRDASSKVAAAVELPVDALALPSNITQQEVSDVISELNAREAVNGFLVLQPLPPHLSRVDVADLLDPLKDIDGITTFNAGRLFHDDRDVLAPSTPTGGMALLKHYNVPLAGQHAVVLGRSPIVGYRWRPCCWLKTQR